MLYFYIVYILNIDLNTDGGKYSSVSSCKTRDGCCFADSRGGDIPR